MNQSLLIIASHIPSGLNEAQTIDKEGVDLEKLFVNSLKNKIENTFLYVNSDYEEVFKKELKKIKSLKAAGGVVKNGDGDYLFIHRLGKWDLPKGKVEANEKTKTAAVREVEEECGVKVDYVGKKLITTYHTYQMSGKFILKQTNWYEMGVNKKPKLVPQKEEDITKAVWMSKADFLDLKEKSYSLISDVMDKVL